ncbi:hypothetical protein LINPERHAP2_LOCUS38209 [Linum perenne]
MKADSKALLGTFRRKEEILVSWNPAPEGSVTINIDGSVIDSQNRAAAGGIVRDHVGRRLSCFTAISANAPSCEQN